jgi:hypothetical protein
MMPDAGDGTHGGASSIVGIISIVKIFVLAALTMQ